MRSRSGAGDGGDPLDPADCRIALERNSPVPLWFQVEEYLASAISSHRFERGELIGTEQELAARFAIGRSTVRRALARLRDRGLIADDRRHGVHVHGTT